MREEIAKYRRNMKKKEEKKTLFLNAFVLEFLFTERNNTGEKNSLVSKREKNDMSER